MIDIAPVADATGNWVDRFAPTWTRPYLRLARADRFNLVLLDRA